jgi:ABC-type nitrate/sulfonate/bicarbonate transport system ATPase subunit
MYETSDTTTSAAGNGAATCISVSHISRWFGDNHVLDDVVLDVPLHGRVGIVGASGGGKSTLLSLICGLDEPDAGTVSVQGCEDRGDRLERCALMPQRDLLLPWRLAIDNAGLALENKGMSRREARARVQPMFERFGLASAEMRRPAELSGGMRQRVAFLRTLLAEKEVLLLDEPFGALDSITRAGMQDWLSATLDAEPRTVVLVTHDVEEALLLCREVVVVSSRPGRIVERLQVGVDKHRPRREVISHPEFVALRERAMEALGT